VVGRIRLGVFLSVVALASAGAGPVRADDAAPADAKQRGDDALVAGRPAEALAAYDEAYAAKPDPALLFNRGRAYMALGDYPAALDQLEAFRRDASPELRAKVPGLDKLLGEVRLRVSDLVVGCDQLDAAVVLDGKKLGTTPLARVLRVAPGKSTLEIAKEGFHTWKRDVTLAPGGSLSIDARLASKETSGVLAISANVAGASVSVDGTPEGNVPSEVALLAGRHTVTLARDGYKPSTSAILLVAGEHKTLAIDLEPESPITKKWWFWTGVGVVAASAALTVVLLTSEKDAGAGNIAPGKISAGLRF
jgi:hypothetical protein